MEVTERVKGGDFGTPYFFLLRDKVLDLVFGIRQRRKRNKINRIERKKK
jgi:hypothetical protein